MKLFLLYVAISRKKSGGFSLPSGLKKNRPVVKKNKTVDKLFFRFILLKIEDVYNSNNKVNETVLLMELILGPSVNP